LACREDPVLYAKAFHKFEPEPHQADFLRAVADRDVPRVAVRSGRQCGKTSALAIAAAWFEWAHQDARTLVTAPSSGQLEDAFVPELKGQINRLPQQFRDLWTVKKDRLEFRFTDKDPFENFITIKTARADSPESMQGMNAPNVLVLIDEAAGVVDPIFEAISGSLAGNKGLVKIVLTGNPNRTSGFFYDAFHVDSDDWQTFHWDSEQLANNGNRISPDWVERMRRKYGDDSDPFRVHVKGEFPRGDANTVIPVSLVEDAVIRDVDPSPSAKIVWGLDVARFGNDKSALCKRKGNVLLGHVQRFSGLDTMQLASQVYSQYEASSQKPVEILVDSIGVGAGVVDRLRALGLPVRGINVGESPAIVGTNYLNLRTELWFKVRDWLEQRDVKLPNDRELIDELVSVRMDYTPAGKTKLESKKDMKKRGAGSPDGADALALTFASTAATLTSGRSFARDKPLKRNLPSLV